MRLFYDKMVCMEKRELYEKLTSILGTDRVLADEPMDRHTTFRIGGPADYLVMPENAEEIRECIRICRETEIPYYIIGNGSNLLVGDGGIRGLVIEIGDGMSGVVIDGERIRAGAGTKLGYLARQAMEAGLSGLEFAGGIPGSFGGAVFMNAGAYGGEMRQVIETVDVLTKDGEELTIPAEEMDFSYRHSIVSEKGYIVLGAALKLEKKDREEILALMDDLAERRTSKQPLNYPSAGSTFKRPEGYFAGKLIQDAGLRGFRIGGAMVSEKHCGFVINAGGATAADVIALMAHIQDEVERTAGVRLEPEVRKIGEFI